MYRGATDFSFIDRAAKMFNQLRLVDFEVVVANERSDAAGAGDCGRIVLVCNHVKSPCQRGLQQHSRDQLCGQTCRCRFASRWRRAGRRAARLPLAKASTLAVGRVAAARCIRGCIASCCARWRRIARRDWNQSLNFDHAQTDKIGKFAL